MEVATPIHRMMERLRIRGARLPLWSRAALAAVTFIALVEATVFAGLDRLVSTQFSRLHAQRVDEITAEVRHALEREGQRLLSTARLVAADTDLVNSTYYHLYLEGERLHPERALRRIARAFDLPSVTLWNADNGLIASAPGHAAPARPPASEDGFQVVRAAGDLWLGATARVRREGETIARLHIAAPLRTVVERVVGDRLGRAISIVPPDTDPPAGRAVVSLPGAPGTRLAIHIPDTAAEVLHEAKRLLLVILTGAGLLLGLATALFLRHHLRPVGALTEGAARIGQGELGHRVPEHGGRELMQLARAFNAMAADLGRLRELERRLEHQERLSAIGRVAARIAHDLNNPLSVILNVTALLKRRLGTDPAVAHDLELIEHHGKRCSRIVEQLLDYGRPVRLRLADSDLREVTRQAVERWRVAHGAVEVTLRNAPGHYDTCLDPFQLERMLANLLDNALEAGGDPIAVELRHEGDEALIVIRDRGPGFPPEVRQHLFEPFFTTKRGGTGLGLASALAIARAHGGDVVIGDGTGGEVRVRLPLRPCDASPPPRRRRAADAVR